jgi:site-specific DNA recombinase
MGASTKMGFSSAKRAVIYCRVSTKDQLQNLSLPTQQKTCGEYCQRNGYDVAEVFVEKGDSAKTADRTELKKLLAYCRRNKGHIGAVVVYSLNRFARELYDHHVLRLQLATLGITLRSATEPIDDSSAGKLMEGIIASMAQFDNDVRSERTVAGMKARLERGGWTFPPPLGYLKGRDTNGRKTIVPDPDRASLITQAFEMYATGLYSKQQVLETVRRLDLTAKSGKRVSAQTFNALLSKPIYAGILAVPAWGIRQPGNIIPLVAKETFDTVQALLSGKRPMVKAHERNNPDFPLRHFVRCGRCDRPLTGSWSKGRNGRYAYYRCQNRSCKAVHIRREEMEQAFVEFLAQLQPKPEYLRLFSEIIIDVWKEKQAKATAMHQAAERQLKSLRERKQRLVEVFVYERKIDQMTYQEQLDKLNEQIALVEIEERDARIEELDVQTAVSFGEYVLLNAVRLWQEFSPDPETTVATSSFPGRSAVCRCRLSNRRNQHDFLSVRERAGREKMFGSANGNRTRI